MEYPFIAIAPRSTLVWSGWEFLGLKNFMFLHDKDYYYHVWFFTCAHIQIFLI